VQGVVPSLVARAVRSAIGGLQRRIVTNPVAGLAYRRSEKVFLLSGTSRTSRTGSGQQSLPRNPNCQQNLAAPLDSPQFDGGRTLVIVAHNSA